MINDLFEEVGSGFGFSLYADDGALWKRGKNVRYVVKQLQRALGVVERWSALWGLRISTAKTKFVVFGRR
ncbi:hypothetical protein AAFF_G00088630, partial [Aldrovandia affinis]